MVNSEPSLSVAFTVRVSALDPRELPAAKVLELTKPALFQL